MCKYCWGQIGTNWGKLGQFEANWRQIGANRGKLGANGMMVIVLVQ